MGGLLMTVGASLCGLSVLSFLLVVGLVVWEGERIGVGALGDLSGDVALPGPAGETVPRRHRKRLRLRINPRYRRMMGGFILALALIGVLGSLLWIAGYLLIAAGPEGDLQPAMRAMRHH
jgi:hypothetical protein